MHWGLRGRSVFLNLFYYERKKYKVRRYSSSVCDNDICIISGVRTPIGSFQGKLASISAVELGSTALCAAVEKSCVDRNAVQELVLGNVFPAGGGQSISFQVAMSAGLSDTIIHSSVNKLCGSGMKAVMNGCQLISTKSQELVAVGGVESLSNAPYIIKRKQKPVGNWKLKDSILHDGLVDPYDNVDVTSYAEQTIKEYNYTREDLDCYALESYSRAAEAQQNNVFSEEMIPIVIKKKNDKEEVICEDEEVKRLKIEKFRTLKPEMGKDGTITPGNTSGLADGAAMLILASGNYVLKNNLKPLARIISYADASLHRKHFVVAIAVAIRKALIRANLNVCQIDVWEISETFPVSALLNAKLLEIDLNKVNVNGGTISLGHPFGMTGARIIVHLVHTLCSGMLGCASISHATGGGSAVIIEKL